MDNATATNIAALRQKAEQTIDQNSDVLQQLCQALTMVPVAT